MQTIKVILNPIAGMGTAVTKIPIIESLLRKHSISYDLVRTERVGHAIELAEQIHPRDFGVVLAAGGDGTSNEVLNGLMRAKNCGRPIPAMGVLPIGRGNDFAYGMGLPQDLEENVVLLTQGHRRLMDVGRVVGGFYPQGRFFGNGIGIGFSTIVGFEAAKMKHLHGFLTYVIGAIKTLFLYYRAPHLRIELDHHVLDQKSIDTAIMIGRRFGGTFFMAPEAAIDDGLFDLCVANNAPRLEMLKLIVKYMKGTQKENKYIRVHRSRKVILSAAQGTLAVHADGETICEKGTRLEIECFPRHIEIIARSGVNHRPSSAHGPDRT